MTAALVLLLGGGCTEPLVGDEVVVPGEAPTSVLYGPPSSELGATVDWQDGLLIATAARTGTLTVGRGSVEADAVWAGWWGVHVVHADSEGEIYVDGAARWSMPHAVVYASGDGAVVAADESRLYWLDRQISRSARGIQSLAVGQDRVLAVRCEETCAGEAWSLDGEPLGAFADAGFGGGVGEWAGVAWAGAPNHDDPEATGRVRSELGEEWVGLPGDHLGATIGGGYAGGVFNKWIVPARARLVPLLEGATYAMERGAEDQPLTLAGDDSTLVVGAPFYPHGGTPSGAVLQIGR